MSPIRPTFGPPPSPGAAASSAVSAARAVVDGFVALLAMAVEPRGSAGGASAGAGGGEGAAERERDNVPDRSPEPTFGYAEAPSPIRAPAPTPGASDEDPGWTPLPAPRAMGWTPLPASNAEGPWTPTLRAPEPSPPATSHPGPPPEPEAAAAAPVAPDPPARARTPDLGVPTAPSAPVPHGRSRSRSTLPPQALRSTPLPAQRAGWVPGVSEPGVPELGAPELGADRLAPRPPLGRSPRGGTAEPPDPPVHPPGPPGTGLDAALGPAATPITPERRAARYAQTAVATAEDAVGHDARAVAVAAGAGDAPLDPARFVTPFLAYERQQGPRMARTLGAAPPPDPVDAVFGADPDGAPPSTAVRVSPGSPVGRREPGAGAGDPEPDLPHGPSVAAVPPSPSALPAGTPAAATSGAVPAEATDAPLDLVEVDPDALPLPAARQADPDGVERVRVQLARDLALEVADRDGRVDVKVVGSAEAVQPLRDLGPELDAGLLAGGFQLGQYEAHARDGAGEPPDGDGEAASPKSREPERQAPPAPRSRFGRYA